MNQELEKYITVHGILEMRVKMLEGYECYTWTCNMTDPWRFSMRLLSERKK